jgi:hypothetical protein
MLREQAAACRRLAAGARTRPGRTSLGEVDDHFNNQAHQLDPLSMKR